MRRYKVFVSLENNGQESDFDSIASSSREHDHCDTEGIANIGWCFGCAIAEAIRGLEGVFSNSEFDDIFAAIGMDKDDYDLEHMSNAQENNNISPIEEREEHNE